MSLVALLLLGLGVLVTLRLSRRPLSGTAWMLLRSLLPSWRFFEDVEPGPALSFRVASSDGQYGPWREAIEPRAGASALLLNAEGNLRLSYQSLVEQLEAELDGVELTVAPNLVPYRLVQRLVEQRAKQQSGDVRRYQFRIGDADDGFISEEHSC
jgi:hypothetical protein